MGHGVGVIALDPEDEVGVGERALVGALTRVGVCVGARIGVDVAVELALAFAARGTGVGRGAVTQPSNPRQARKANTKNTLYNPVMVPLWRIPSLAPHLSSNVLLKRCVTTKNCVYTELGTALSTHGSR